MRGIKKLVIAVSAAFLAVPVGAAYAVGDIDLKVTDHYRTWSTSSEQYVRLRHLGGDVPYTKFYRDANPSTERTLENKSGIGSTIISNKGSHVFKMKGCYTRAAWPDKCTDWHFDYSG